MLDFWAPMSFFDETFTDWSWHSLLWENIGENFCLPTERLCSDGTYKVTFYAFGVRKNCSAEPENVPTDDKWYVKINYDSNLSNKSRITKTSITRRNVFEVTRVRHATLFFFFGTHTTHNTHTHTHKNPQPYLFFFFSSILGANRNIKKKKKKCMFVSWRTINRSRCITILFWARVIF